MGRFIWMLVCGAWLCAACSSDEADPPPAPTPDVDAVVADVAKDACETPPCGEESAPDIAEVSQGEPDVPASTPDVGPGDPEDVKEEEEEDVFDPCGVDPCGELSQPAAACVGNSTAIYATTADCKVGAASLGGASQILEDNCSGCHGNTICTVFNACFMDDTGDMWHAPVNQGACGDAETVAECAVKRMLEQSMPPGNNPKVLPEDTALLEQWIEDTMGNTVALPDGVLCEFQVVESVDCTPQVLSCGAGECVTPDLTLEESLIITDEASLAPFVGVTVLNGNLTIAANELGDISLPYLQEVKGSILVESAGGLTGLSMPNLTTVGSQLKVQDNPDLAALDMPALETVATTLYLSNNSTLENLEIAALSSVGADLVAQENPSLEDLTLPDLVSVGGKLSVSGNGNLTSLKVVQLATVGGSLLIYGNSALSTLSLSAVESATGKVRFAGMPGLKTMGLGGLTFVTGDLEFSDLAALDYL
ncbi:MAG: hypothetical protein VYE15_05305, partial [Myxococcota bacterium]|nr:hypothetical protein [Myxococcota bacterium]